MSEPAQERNPPRLLAFRGAEEAATFVEPPLTVRSGDHQGKSPQRGRLPVPSARTCVRDLTARALQHKRLLFLVVFPEA